MIFNVFESISIAINKRTITTYNIYAHTTNIQTYEDD